jgi:nucleotidyltransferase AbiEii toxin of type IV toxin-antitoxin system
VTRSPHADTVLLKGAIEDSSDGVIFEPATISVESIRDATEYVGTRIRVQARLDKVRQTVQIDVGIGDAVHPEPQVIDYPVILTSPPVRLNASPRGFAPCMYSWSLSTTAGA